MSIYEGKHRGADGRDRYKIQARSVFATVIQGGGIYVAVSDVASFNMVAIHFPQDCLWRLTRAIAQAENR